MGLPVETETFVPQDTRVAQREQRGLGHQLCLQTRSNAPKHGPGRHTPGAQHRAACSSFSEPWRRGE